eukprot:g1758.t1
MKLRWAKQQELPSKAKASQRYRWAASRSNNGDDGAIAFRPGQQAQQQLLLQQEGTGSGRDQSQQAEGQLNTSWVRGGEYMRAEKWVKEVQAWRQVDSATESSDRDGAESMRTDDNKDNDSNNNDDVDGGGREDQEGAQADSGVARYYEWLHTRVTAYLAPIGEAARRRLHARHLRERSEVEAVWHAWRRTTTAANATSATTRVTEGEGGQAQEIVCLDDSDDSDNEEENENETEEEEAGRGTSMMELESEAQSSQGFSSQRCAHLRVPTFDCTDPDNGLGADFDSMGLTNVDIQGAALSSGFVSVAKMACVPVRAQAQA